jgi:hypothetical protein
MINYKGLKFYGGMYMLKDFFMNARKPGGFGGKIILWLMNVGHNITAKGGLSYLNIKHNDIILDIGCRGGRNITHMLKTQLTAKYMDWIVLNYLLIIQ